MTPTAQAPVAGRRRFASRVALVAAVLAMHACVMRSINDSVIDFNPGGKPARIELVPVRDMAFSAPAAAVAVSPPPALPAPPRPPRQAKPVAEAASAPAVAASAAEPETETVAAA
eukprot:gene66378-90867_t